MKKLIILTIFSYSYKLCIAQDAAMVMKRYQEAISKINYLAYDINRIDTFVSGTVWNKSGVCNLRRNPLDDEFGFSFSGKRNDVPEIGCYDGKYFFSVNHDQKTYEARHKPGPGILGHPGGQMVSEEFIRADTGYKSISVAETPEHFVLQFQFPDIPEYDVRNRTKKLFLDKKTFLPQHIISYQHSLDKKQVQIRTFSKLVINDPNSDQEIDIKESMATYKQLNPSTKNELAELVGREAPQFSLQTFTGRPVSLEQLRGKLVLLDFWEVWCGPCIQSIPKVQAMHEKYSGKGLVVLGVTLDKDNLSSNKLFTEKKKLTYSNGLGNEEMEKTYKVNAIPEYILIDQSGKIILAQAGFSDEIEKKITEKLGK